MLSLGWGINFTDGYGTERKLREAAGQLSVEDLLSMDQQPSKAASLLKADLPRELALLDVESSLPRLSTLPSTGAEYVPGHLSFLLSVLSMGEMGLC